MRVVDVSRCAPTAAVLFGTALARRPRRSALAALHGGEVLLTDNGDWAVKRNRQFRRVRRRFFVALWEELHVIWPIASGLVAIQLLLGALVSLIQGWPLGDAFYFTFVTAFTIGYGDLVPKGFVARLIAVVIGLTGVLLTGLIAAVGVRALQVATAESVGSPRRSRVVGPGNSEESCIGGGRKL
jgi:hypothetical protein